MGSLTFSENPLADACLRQATAQKEGGNLFAAILALRKAYAYAERGEVAYPVETFLRLPLYLQQAGERDAAWEAMVTLLKVGYPHQNRIPELIPMDESVVYDKMRLFLQRDGLHVHAILYGLLSHLSWGVGLARQGRLEEMREHLSQPCINAVAAKLLTRARQLSLLAVVMNLLVQESENILHFAPAAFAAKVKTLFDLQ